MSQIIGELRPEATFGEKQVLELLNKFSDDYIIWPEHNIGSNNPDFIVLHPKLGLLILEIKDWVTILEGDPDKILIQSRKGKSFREINPLKKIRAVAINIADRLQEVPALLNSGGPHLGKLCVPWNYAVVFMNFTRMDVMLWSKVLDPKWIITREDLIDADTLEARFKSLPQKFPCALKLEQIDLIRRTIYPHLKISNLTLDTGMTLSLDQERAAKDGLFERAQWDENLSPEGEDAARSLAVRMVRGVAGSGKTLVLGLRAKLVAEANPEWKILVVSYNKSLASYLHKQFAESYPNIQVMHFHLLCSDWLKEKSMWREPIPGHGQVGWVQRVLQNLENGDAVDAEFLVDEFNWMRDTLIVDRKAYLKAQRTGRKLSLKQAERNHIFDIYEAYQNFLALHNRFDWADVPLRVLKGVELGLIPHSQFDAILIDEAQDFAPAWFEVLKKILNPQTGVVFMAADAAQRIYQKFTWKSLGFNVVGQRTRILRRPYRNTYEIMSSAYEMIRGHEVLLREIEEQEEVLIDPEMATADMRHGDYPVLKLCRDSVSEEQHIAKEITILLSNGYEPRDIAVLSRKTLGLHSLRTVLKNQGVKTVVVSEKDGHSPDAVALSTLHSAKGLEYRIVFIAHLQTMFDMSGIKSKEKKDEFEANEMRLMYVGMTRARERLHMTYHSILPRQLHSLRAFLDRTSKMRTK